MALLPMPISNRRISNSMKSERVYVDEWELEVEPERAGRAPWKNAYHNLHSAVLHTVPRRCLFDQWRLRSLLSDVTRPTYCYWRIRYTSYVHVLSFGDEKMKEIESLVDDLDPILLDTFIWCDVIRDSRLPDTCGERIVK